MEKLKSSLPNMVGVLVGFSIIIGGLLAYVNHVTEGPIKHKQEQTLAAGIKTVMKNNNVKVADPETVNETIDGKAASFIIHPCADNAGNKIGSAVESTTNGFGGDLQVLVGFDNDGVMLPYLRKGQEIGTVDIFSSQMAVEGIRYAINMIRQGLRTYDSYSTPFKIICGGSSCGLS